MELNKLHQHFLSSKGTSTDTRQQLEDTIFFALKGDNFDGNRFAENALKNGAKLAVVDDKELPKHPKFALVDDVLTTLQQLATYHRNYLNLPILAITGSNGKTTTKELVARVLSKKYNTVYTQGNLNNHIGVPLTLLTMDDSTEMGIVEMGANHQKEVDALCHIALPDYGHITNFGKAHLEGFGGIEGVIKGKSELYDFLIKNKGKVFINADDDLQVQKSKGATRISFGETQTQSCQVNFKSADPYVEVEFDHTTITSQLLGNYNAKNIAAAICIGSYFEVGKTALKNAIETYTPDDNRSQVLRQGSNDIILDAYNANPTSMQLALENFESYPGDKKVVILGDMFEVGETALAEHQHTVNTLEGMRLDQAYVCGENFAQTKTSSVSQFENFEALKDEVAKQNFHNAVILIKGSRGMALERLVNIL